MLNSCGDPFQKAAETITVRYSKSMKSKYIWTTDLPPGKVVEKKFSVAVFLKLAWRMIRGFLIIAATISGFVLAGVLWPLTFLLFALFPAHVLAFLSTVGRVRIF